VLNISLSRCTLARNSYGSPLSMHTAESRKASNEASSIISRASIRDEHPLKKLVGGGPYQLTCGQFRLTTILHLWLEPFKASSMALMLSFLPFTLTMCISGRSFASGFASFHFCIRPSFTSTTRKAQPPFLVVQPLMSMPQVASVPLSISI